QLPCRVLLPYATLFRSEASLGDDDLLPGVDEVGEHLAVFVDDDGSRRDVEGQVLATGPVPIVAGAVVAALGAHVRGEAEVQEGVDRKSTRLNTSHVSTS